MHKAVGLFLPKTSCEKRILRPEPGASLDNLTLSHADLTLNYANLTLNHANLGPERLK